jgi:hypothetical protein
MISVLKRIQAKIDLLETWLETGIPNVIGDDGIERPSYVPTSLNKARIWENAEEGIFKIGDPSSFTTVHPKHGSKVVELDNLINRMKAVRSRPKSSGRSLNEAGAGGKPPGRSLKEQLAALRRNYADLEKRHVKVVSQLAAAHEEAERERTQRMNVERVLAHIRKKERAEAARAGRAALELVRTGDPTEA